MDSHLVDLICNQIYKQFPEVSGAHPKVSVQSDSGAEKKYLIIFKGSATTADGKKMSRVVRVVANEQGKIIKVTTSR